MIILEICSVAGQFVVGQFVGDFGSVRRRSVCSGSVRRRSVCSGSVRSGSVCRERLYAVRFFPQNGSVRSGSVCSNSSIGS